MFVFGRCIFSLQKIFEVIIFIIYFALLLYIFSTENYWNSNAYLFLFLLKFCAEHSFPCRAHSFWLLSKWVLAEQTKFLVWANRFWLRKLSFRAEQTQLLGWANRYGNKAEQTSIEELSKPLLKKASLLVLKCIIVEFWKHRCFNLYKHRCCKMI